MTQLMTFHDVKELKKGKVIRYRLRSMLWIRWHADNRQRADSQDQLRGRRPSIRPRVNPQTFAMCKSDLYMKSSDGRDAENIAFGSTLSSDGHADRTFDYMLANPPYGKDWNSIKMRCARKRDGQARIAS